MTRSKFDLIVGLFVSFSLGSSSSQTPGPVPFCSTTNDVFSSSMFKLNTFRNTSPSFAFLASYREFPYKTTDLKLCGQKQDTPDANFMCMSSTICFLNVWKYIFFPVGMLPHSVHGVMLSILQIFIFFLSVM